MELDTLTPDLPTLLVEMGIRYDPDKLAAQLSSKWPQVGGETLAVTSLESLRCLPRLAWWFVRGHLGAGGSRGAMAAGVVVRKGGGVLAGQADQRCCSCVGPACRCMVVQCALPPPLVASLRVWGVTMPWASWMKRWLSGESLSLLGKQQGWKGMRGWQQRVTGPGGTGRARSSRRRFGA